MSNSYMLLGTLDMEGLPTAIVVTGDDSTVTHVADTAGALGELVQASVPFLYGLPSEWLPD